MTRKLFRIMGALVLLGFAGMVHAASVSLVPTTPTNPVKVGDTVSFDVVIDFTADGGTLGGGFDVIFDSSQLAFAGLVSAGLGDPAFGRDPDVLDGLLESWAVGDFNGLDSGLVGSVSFEVLAGATSSFVALGPTSGVGGPFVSAVTYDIITPDYNQVEVVAAVPVPAAVWLFASALLGLFGGKRFAKSL